MANSRAKQSSSAPLSSTTHLPGPPGGSPRAEAQIEEELQSHCAELERQLKQDDFSVQNETLEVQLAQMQDDYAALQVDFTNMCDYLHKKITERNGQLEEQTRAACTAEGHADCLRDLLHFHEDQGQLVSSYWQAQCEKRDDSIRFLTLKLQEYTVLSSEYRARRQAALVTTAEPMDPAPTPATSSSAPAPSAAATAAPGAGGAAPHLLSSAMSRTSQQWSQPEASSARDAAGEAAGAGSAAFDGSAHSPADPSADPDKGSSGTAGAPGETPAPEPSTGQAYQTLLDQHLERCRELQDQEVLSRQLEQELQATELKCAALRGQLARRKAQRSKPQPEESSPSKSFGTLSSFFSTSTQEAPAAERRRSQERAEELEAMEAECSRLRSEVEACEQGLADNQSGQLPTWAHRCVWRDELDVRAGQLERISLQFDATKRSLDAANEELQWQATSAEALRMRLADVQRAIKGEEAKTSELRAEHRQSQNSVEALLQHWSQPRDDNADEAEVGFGGTAFGSTSAMALPLVCQQAQWLLESIRRSESPEVQVDSSSAGTTASHAMGTSGFGSEASAGFGLLQGALSSTPSTTSLTTAGASDAASAIMAASRSSTASQSTVAGRGARLPSGAMEAQGGSVRLSI